MKKIICVIFFLLISPPLIGKESFNSTQQQNLKIAHEVGQKFGTAETLQAIMLQESKAGIAPQFDKNLSEQKRSYGVMQIQVNTARETLKRNPSLMHQYFPDRTVRSIKQQELISLLIQNKEANIHIAAHVLQSYYHITGSWERAIVGYNVGIYKAIHFPSSSIANSKYLRSIKRHRAAVHMFNEQENLNVGSSPPMKFSVDMFNEFKYIS